MMYRTEAVWVLVFLTDDIGALILSLLQVQKNGILQRTSLWVSLLLIITVVLRFVHSHSSPPSPSSSAFSSLILCSPPSSPLAPQHWDHPEYPVIYSQGVFRTLSSSVLCDTEGLNTPTLPCLRHSATLLYLCTALYPDAHLRHWYHFSPADDS